MLRSSAAASTRVFFVDILGTSGYQAVFGGIGGGAEGLQIAEEETSLESLSHDLKIIKNSFLHGKQKVIFYYYFFTFYFYYSFFFFTFYFYYSFFFFISHNFLLKR
jgi:magnesium-transporting ATPase (P-type)